MADTVKVLVAFDAYLVGDKHQTKLKKGQDVPASKFRPESLAGLARNKLLSVPKALLSEASTFKARPLRSATDRATDDKEKGVETRKEIIPGSGIYDDGSAQSDAIDSQVAKEEKLFEDEGGSDDDGEGDDGGDAEDDSGDDAADDGLDLSGDVLEEADDTLADHELSAEDQAEEAARLAAGGFMDLDGASINHDSSAPAETAEAAEKAAPKRGRPRKNG